MKINVLKENTDYRQKKKIHLDSFVKNQVTKASTYIHAQIYSTYIYIELKHSRRAWQGIILL